MPNPPSPRYATVNVIVDDIATNKYHFETSDLPLGPNNLLTFDNTQGHSGFIISYVLHGAEGYAFPADLQEAIYVKAGSQTDCPKSRSSWGQFQPKEVRDGGRTLVVDNKNNSVSAFAYTLRATNGDGWLNLDPGGMNQNGGGSPPVQFLSATTLFIAFAVVAIVVAFFALR